MQSLRALEKIGGRLEKAKIYANRIRNTRIATTRMEIKRLVEVDILQC